MSNETQVSLEEALAIAQQYHTAGNLTLADRTYRDILAVMPEEFNSLHHLSIICYQLGKPEEGLELIQKAVSIQDNNPNCWNAYGVMQAQVGDYEKAIEKWEKALELDPDFHEALSNLGNALWEIGEFERSREMCEKAIKIKPDFPEAYNNLGIALASLDEKEEALKIWEKALEYNPTSHDVFLNMGNTLRELGRPTESEEYCNKALELAPDHPKALFNLGNALRDQGKLKKAEDAYRKAVESKPDFVDAYNNLTLILIQMLRYKEALTSARYVIAFEPEHAVAYGYQALILKELGKLKEAEESARKSLQINPDSADSKVELADILYLSDKYSEAETLFDEVMEELSDSYYLYLKLSGVLERQNKIDEALDAVKKALELSPETPEIYYRKAMILFMSGNIEEADKALDKALEIKPDFSVALGIKSEILQSRGEMDKALEVARQGLDLGDDVPSVFLTLSKVKKFKDKKDPDFLKMKEIEKSPAPKGYSQVTSLHFALFKAHQDMGEYEDAFKHLKIGNDTRRANVVYDRTMQHTAFDNLKKIYTKDFFSNMEGLGHDSDVPIFIVGMPRSGTTLTEQIISSHPDVFGGGELSFISDIDKEIGAPTPENCKQIGEEYVKRVRAISEESAKARKITDKMPGNYLRLPSIITGMPNAKIIHCRRNPMDTCLSCYKQLFARGHYWSYNLDEMAEHYTVYHSIMEYWRETLPENSFLEIDYEQTVDDFENQARRLLDFVEMEWDDACLTPHKTKRSVMTASKGQVIQPIYKTSVEAWRRYEEQLSPLYKKLKQYM